MIGKKMVSARALEASEPGCGMKDQSFFHIFTVTLDPVLGCSQAIPLVPLTEENEEAIENEQFQQLLRKLGVRPPTPEQASLAVTVSAETCWFCSNASLPRCHCSLLLLSVLISYCHLHPPHCPVITD
jgi:hypothetical protein